MSEEINMDKVKMKSKNWELTVDGMWITCSNCGTKYQFAGKDFIKPVCPTCKGIKTCENCFFNYGNEHHTEYNPEDIVCTYWESDGQTVRDFCSHWKWKGETE